MNISEIECELCDGAGEIQTHDGQYVGCPECVSRDQFILIQKLKVERAELERQVKEKDVVPTANEKLTPAKLADANDGAEGE